MTDTQEWKRIQTEFLAKNSQNFTANVPMDKPTILARARQSIIGILYEFSDYFKDGNQCIRRIMAGYYDRIGKWNPFAKVHK